MKLISIKDVSQMLAISRKTAEFYINDPSFPKAIRLPNGKGGYSHPKWEISDVEKWVNSYRRK